MPKNDSRTLSSQTKNALGLLLRWVMFTFAVSVVPLGIKYMVLQIVNQYKDLTHMISDGSLFLIACAITAEAIGDTLSAPKQQQQVSILALLLGGCSLLTLLIAATLYGIAALVPLAGTPSSPLGTVSLNISYITTSSMLTFVFAIVAGIGSKWYNAIAQHPPINNLTSGVS